MKVVGYIRCSTEEQVVDGVTLQAQAAKLRAYCDLYDLDLVEVIEDAGVSAKTLDRGASRGHGPCSRPARLTEWSSPSSIA
jgi:DNA invertase Pin-like site-specific DNA recombinase